jgi:hypothetical protein
MGTIKRWICTLVIAGCTTSPSTTKHQAISSVASPPSDPHQRLGIYNWGADTTGYTFSDALTGPAGLISQIGARTIRVALSTNDAYGHGTFATLTAAASSPAFQSLFGSSSFDMYILTSYSQADNPANGCLPLWVNGYAPADAAAERGEIANLAEYLGATYPSKKFLIQNWEGDSAIGALNHYCGTTLTPALWQGYTDWINARAEGVLDARAGGVTHVWSGLEFNSVQRLTSSEDYYGNNCAAPDATALTAGCSWCDGSHPCVISTVGPNALVDYLSYSSWQSVGVGIATHCVDGGGSDVACDSVTTGCAACYASDGSQVTCPAACGGPTGPAPGR